MVILAKNVNLKIFFLFCALFFKIGANEIIPYKLFKFFDQDKSFKRPTYIVPKNCKHIISRTKFANNSLVNINEITNSIYYYLSIPKKENYPIVILIGGSIDLTSLKQSWSIIDIHRFYLQEIMEIDAGLLTVEKLGINDASYNEKLIFDHYTRSQILFDHEALINNLLQNPPPGWNGEIILWGISEGGYIAQKIAEKYQNNVTLLILWASFLDIRNNPNFYWESMQEFYNQFKETSIKNKIIYYCYDTLSYFFELFCISFPKKNTKQFEKK